MTQQEIIDRLKAGNERFVSTRKGDKNFENQNKPPLTDDQTPYAIILSCSDCEVVPEYIFDTGIDELFVIRVVGNVADSAAVASVEYAIARFNTAIILVLGHQACGVVKASLKNENDGYDYNHLLEHIEPAIAEAGEGASIDAIVKKNAEQAAKELVESSTIIRSAFEQGQVNILSAFYNQESGQVEML